MDYTVHYSARGERIVTPRARQSIAAATEPLRSAEKAESVARAAEAAKAHRAALAAIEAEVIALRATLATKDAALAIDRAKLAKVQSEWLALDCAYGHLRPGAAALPAPASTSTSPVTKEIESWLTTHRNAPC